MDTPVQKLRRVSLKPRNKARHDEVDIFFGVTGAFNPTNSHQMLMQWELLLKHIRKLWGGDRARRADDEPEVDLSRPGFINSDIRDAADEQTKTKSRNQRVFEVIA